MVQKNINKIETVTSQYINSFFKTDKPDDQSPNIDIHFIGCGGIGMCGLSILCKQFGFTVTGSDIKESKNTKYLRDNDISVYIRHSIDNLPENISSCLIVYSSAVSRQNIELRAAIEMGIPCYKRGDFLAFISTHYKTVVSIAGSHGKTTVTSMLVHILKNTSFSKLGYLIGGWPVDANTLGSVGDGNIFVIEADESDLSLTSLKSDFGVILNIDDDHSWNIGGNDKLNAGFVKFANKSKEVILADNNNNNGFLKKIITQNLKLHFVDNNIKSIAFPNNLYGQYQINNMAVAITVAKLLGVKKAYSIKSLATFHGVERRMQKVFSTPQLIIFEDYAHHPTEIKEAINALKNKYPARRITLIFQPHRYARLKHYFNRFVEELKNVDKVFIVPTFSAWSEKENISEKALSDAIGSNSVFINASWKMVANSVINKYSFHNDIILVLGAGDINLILPELISCLKS